MKLTKKNLQTIKELWNSASLKDSIQLIELIKEMWWMPERGIKFIASKSGWTLELHTLGWSENEDIIYALENSMFWMLYWQKSERGGHYYFEKKGGE